MVNSRIIFALCTLFFLACEEPPPASPDKASLAAEIVWDLLLEEPSGLAALPDGRLLSVGDGGRGLVYELAVEGEKLSVTPAKFNIREFGHLPHEEFPDKQAPDLEGIAPTRDGRLAIAAEYWNEIWEIDPRLKVVVGLWRFPQIEDDGSIAECLGPSRNHGNEGVAFDPLRGIVLGIQERCPPGLVIFEEKSGRARRTYARAALDERLGHATPRYQITTGTLSGAAWAGRAGAFYLLDRLRRHIILIEIGTDFEIVEKGRWSFAGVFVERGKHAQYGNAEGIAVTGEKLYLISDPGEGATAQLARFALPR